MLSNPIPHQTHDGTAATHSIATRVTRRDATHGLPEAAHLLGGREQPPLRLREGFSDEEKGEEASPQGGAEGEGGRWLQWLERVGRSWPLGSLLAAPSRRRPRQLPSTGPWIRHSGTVPLPRC